MLKGKSKPLILKNAGWMFLQACLCLFFKIIFEDKFLCDLNFDLPRN